MSYTTKNQVSIIIPTKDEPNLTSLISDLSEVLQNELFYMHEIIVITSDKSKTLLPSLPENVKVFKSYGDSLERAILLGFSVAQGDHIIVMDADGSHSPKYVHEFLKHLKTHEMVVASRFIEGGRYYTTFPRFLTSIIFNGIAKLLGSTLSDPMSGFFGIQSQLLTKIKFKPIKWKVALEIHNKLRPNTKEIPILFQNRVFGRSKSHWKVGLKILWDMLVEAL